MQKYTCTYCNENEALKTAESCQTCEEPPICVNCSFEHIKSCHCCGRSICNYCKEIERCKECQEEDALLCPGCLEDGIDGQYVYCKNDPVCKSGGLCYAMLRYCPNCGSGYCESCSKVQFSIANHCIKFCDN